MRRTFAGILTAAALALGACSYELADVPMPGQISGPTYEITAEFDSALNLPVNAPVKVDGRTIGEVAAIEAIDYRAHVTLRISEDQTLPEGTTAQIRLSAPVGEAFVSLTPPDETDGPLLTAGDAITETSSAPDTTDLLTGLSASVTGGSYADLKVVIDTLVVATEGNAGTVRGLINEWDAFLTTANAHGDDIDALLVGLDRLATQLAADSDSIATSLETMDPALATLLSRYDEALNLTNAFTRTANVTSDYLNNGTPLFASTLSNIQIVVAAMGADLDAMIRTMTGIQAFGSQLDSATPGDYAAFDLSILPPDFNHLITGDLPFVSRQGPVPELVIPPVHPGEFPEIDLGVLLQEVPGLSDQLAPLMAFVSPLLGGD